MANRRVFYAIEQVQILPDGVETGALAYVVHGLQSAGMTTNFNLEKIYELGQLDLYEQIENIPEVELTLEKFLDGYPLIYHLATPTAVSTSLIGRSASKVTAAFSVFSDVQESASGNPVAEVSMSGMFVGSLGYTFPVEGPCSESVTLVGNNRVNRIQNASSAMITQFPGLQSGVWQFVGRLNNDDFPLAVAGGSGSIQRRQNVIFAVPGNATFDVNGQVIANSTILPQCIHGISSSGTNDYNGALSEYGAHVQNIAVNTDLNRDNLLELGHRAPYYKTVSFPVEVTCEISALSVHLDLVGATDEGVQGDGNNTKNYTIRVRTKDGTTINLGTKNRLSNVSYSGGDATGGNVTQTYSFTNSNKMDVAHPQDPVVSLRVS